MDKHDEDLKLLSVQSVKVLLCAVIDTRWSRRQSCTTAAQSGILTSRVNSGIVRWHHHSICRFALSAIQPPALEHTWTWCILDDAIPHWKISFDCEFIHTGCKIIELVKSFKIFQSIFCAQTDCIQLIPNWKSRRMFVFPDRSDHVSKVTPEAQCWVVWFGLVWFGLENVCFSRLERSWFRSDTWSPMLRDSTAGGRWWDGYWSERDSTEIQRRLDPKRCSPTCPYLEMGAHQPSTTYHPNYSTQPL